MASDEQAGRAAAHVQIPEGHRLSCAEKNNREKLGGQEALVGGAADNDLVRDHLVLVPGRGRVHQTLCLLAPHAGGALLAAKH